MSANEKAAVSTEAYETLLRELHTWSDELGKQGVTLSAIPIVRQPTRA
jgi:hypothetical protein